MFANILCTSLINTPESILRQVHGTCKEMLVDRGCQIVSERCPSSLEADEQSHPVIVARRQGATVWVLFHAEDKVGIKTVRSLVESMAREGVEHAVLVSSEGPTPFTKKELGMHANIQCFQYKQLMLNISRLRLCPRHRRVGDEEARALLQQYKREDLPRLLRSDPMCQYYDFPVGSLVEIRREYGGDSSVYYRMVSGP